MLLWEGIIKYYFVIIIAACFIFLAAGCLQGWYLTAAQHAVQAVCAVLPPVLPVAPVTTPGDSPGLVTAVSMPKSQQ